MQTGHPHLVWGWQRAVGEEVFWKCPALQGTQLLLASVTSSGRREAWGSQGEWAQGASVQLWASMTPAGQPLLTHPPQSVLCSIFPSLPIAQLPLSAGRTLNPAPSQLHFSAGSMCEPFSGREKHFITQRTSHLGHHHGHSTLHPFKSACPASFPPSAASDL